MAVPPLSHKKRDITCVSTVDGLLENIKSDKNPRCIFSSVRHIGQCKTV